MKCYVLVHGAWHGGWCWSRVIPLLAGAGYRVLAPTLTGLGDREHLFGAAVDLAWHVRDVLALIEAEELDRVVLVGHSYGGNVITGVADAMRERIAHCVYLDAVVPSDEVTEWCWADNGTAEMRAHRLAAIRDAGCGLALPAPEPASFGVIEEADLQWLARRLRPMPAATYTRKIRLAHGGSAGLRRTYVAATRPVYGPMQATHRRLGGADGWHYVELDTGHDMMLTAPSALAQLLLAC
ncbi:MAG: alpha/beta hydrolase [Burkholderiales bacterium]|nr:MAG: alpha/beta hydrolase [Burkholderiales bacterium]